MSNFLRSRAETDGPWYWEAAQTRFCVTAYQICMRSRAADGTTVVLYRGNTNWKILKNDQKHVKTIFNHLFKYNRAFKENFWANRYHYRDCLWVLYICYRCWLNLSSAVCLVSVVPVCLLFLSSLASLLVTLPASEQAAVGTTPPVISSTLCSRAQ